MAPLTRLGARQDRHQVGAGRVGDPGLAAGQPPAVIGALGAGGERGEVGAGVGLGEDGRGQDRTVGEAGQVARLLLLRAARLDQLGGDLRAGAERPHADEAARQLLGDDAHGELAQPRAAMLLGDGQAEHAQRRQLLDDLDRDELVALMPAMGVRGDALVGEVAELVGDHGQRLVQARIAQAAALAQSRDDLGAVPLDAAGEEGGDGGLVLQGAGGGGEAEMGRPRHLVLAHRDAVDDLRQRLRHRRLEGQALQPFQPAPVAQALGPAGQRLQRLHQRGDPGEAVAHELRVGTGIHRQRGAHRVEIGPRRRARGRGERQAVRGGMGVHGVSSRWMGRVGRWRMGEPATRRRVPASSTVRNMGLVPPAPGPAARGSSSSICRNER